MRNVFDQYDQPENKLTHALVSALAHDRRLIRPFLRWAGIHGVPQTRDLRIVEQQVPGADVSGDEVEAKGLPDACIYTDDGWAVLIESKVQAGIGVGQLRRHISTARSHGFERPHLLVLSVNRPKKRMPTGTRTREWRALFQWFDKQPHARSWAAEFAEYMQVFEARMIAKDYAIRGTITMFSGIKFDGKNPYSYRQGKRLIRLLGDELQGRKEVHKIGVDPKGKRRSAITGRGQDGVWDFLPLRVARGKPFTSYPHLTMVIGRRGATAAVTVPDGVRGGVRTKLRKLGLEGFHAMIREIGSNLNSVIRESKGARPLLYVTQRHYDSQRSPEKVDGRLDADLRTLVESGRGGVKFQPEWVDAVYNIVTRKRSNVQFGVEVRFSSKCPRLRSAKAVGLFAKTWISVKPLLDFVLAEK